MVQQVGQTLFQGGQILPVQFRLGHAAVVFQRPHRGHDHHGGGPQTGQAALDVEKLLRPQVGGKARLGNGIVPQLQGHAGGGDAVAPVGDVGKGPAVDQGRGVLQRLHQVGLQRILQQGRHGPLRLEIVGRHRPPVKGIGHDHPAQPGLQIRDIAGQAQHGHDLAGHGDVEPVLPGDALHPASQAVDNVAELAVVHVHAALPHDLLAVDAQGVALLDVVVQQSGQQVVGRPDGMEVPGEVEVDVLHGDHLGIAAAGGPALHAEHRPQGRLPQGGHGVFADFPQAVGKAHGGGGFPLSGGGWGDGGDQDQLAVGPVRPVPQQAVVDLGLIPAVLLQILGVDAAGGGNIADGQGRGLLGDLNVCHVASPSVFPIFPYPGPGGPVRSIIRDRRRVVT